MARCAWCDTAAEYRAYHDEEWGFPVGDDRRLFEKLSLEGFQSGLSWLTILRKREAFRTAFAGFDVDAVAAFGARDVERLLADARIIRHRGKIEATVNNARRAAEMRAAGESLGELVWSFAPPPRRRAISLEWVRENPVTPESTALSKELKRRGWRFVGPTTAYAFMQSMGLINDHLRGCVAFARVREAREAFDVPGRR